MLPLHPNNLNQILSVPIFPYSTDNILDSSMPAPSISVAQTTKKLAIEQYEPSNTQNSNFITIWATEMAQYKIW